MQAANFQPNVARILEDSVYDVCKDGTYTKETVERFRIETDQGMQECSQISLRYSTSLEELNVLRAYTITRDGRRIDVTPENIIEQQSSESTHAPMFDDNKVKVIVYPGVDIGSTLTLHYRKRQKTPLFPGHFFMLEYFSDSVSRDSVQLIVRAPASMNLRVDVINLSGGRVASDQPDVQLWRWILTNRPAHQPEMASVSDVDYSPRVALSTFPDFAAVGKAYIERAAPKAKITRAIQALADELTHGVTDRRRQAEILYDWVSTHVRYVAVHLGIGNVVPHEADAVLAAAYGDCKDHVTLLEALLAAKSIKSAPVLVNSTNSYWLPEVALPVGVFDHAITYLPEFEMFVDSTARVRHLAAHRVGQAGVGYGQRMRLCSRSGVADSGSRDCTGGGRDTHRDQRRRRCLWHESNRKPRGVRPRCASDICVTAARLRKPSCGSSPYDDRPGRRRHIRVWQCT
ncbi:DUF3857 domain-containing protein [Caballeronia sp. EK]|uniref:DUF3857 domain-containing transglutaminase family protein n=1 Tax=Caballeronia sp. EK TaxID=2767469 RepID=UPI0016559934|nr:DUF3857 domain-containing protein [Caballeronia sp. EK]MBC8642216.1 DUF3857 domain-containing protein [Caballeronia sp. EK]